MTQENDFAFTDDATGFGCAAAVPPLRIGLSPRWHEAARALWLASCLTMPLPALSADFALSTIACHPLMLDEECRTYIAEMARATTPTMRGAIKTRYELLIRDRDQACRCNVAKARNRIARPHPGAITLTLQNRD
ncbi:MAG: hypothetical protein ACLPXB_19905 [Thiobacillaceae bacterium]